MTTSLFSETQTLNLSTGPVEYAQQGTGPTILYFHGIGAGSEVVFPMEQPLLDAGFHLLVPNRPGYFGTSLINRRSTASCARMAVELMDSLGIEKVAVMGTSAGDKLRGPISRSHCLSCPAMLRVSSLGLGPMASSWDSVDCATISPANAQTATSHLQLLALPLAPKSPTRLHTELQRPKVRQPERRSCCLKNDPTTAEGQSPLCPTTRWHRK